MAQKFFRRDRSRSERGLLVPRDGKRHGDGGADLLYQLRKRGVSLRKPRGQNGGTWAVGGNALSVDFTASKDLENMSFHFQLGKAPAETASNVITIDDLKVEEITSVPDTVKETTRFMPYGENTGYDVFNGSDDTSGKFDGTGRIYTDGGALHYIVSNGGQRGLLQQGDLPPRTRRNGDL